MDIDVSKYGKNWIQPGMEVCHIDNPNLAMRAEEIVRRDRRLPDNNVASLVVGVRCTWWEEHKGEKKMRYSIFHTSTILPKEVCDNGPECISKFLSR